MNPHATIIPVSVASGDIGSYDVTVGRSLLDGVAEQIGSAARKVLIVHPATLGAKAAELRESLLQKYEVVLAEIPDAEAAKRVEVAAFCWQ